MEYLYLCVTWLILRDKTGDSHRRSIADQDHSSWPDLHGTKQSRLLQSGLSPASINKSAAARNHVIPPSWAAHRSDYPVRIHLPTAAGGFIPNRSYSILLLIKNRAIYWRGGVPPHGRIQTEGIRSSLSFDSSVQELICNSVANSYYNRLFRRPPAQGVFEKANRRSSSSLEKRLLHRRAILTGNPESPLAVLRRSLLFECRHSKRKNFSTGDSNLR
jgi:hypothetical protein